MYSLLGVLRTSELLLLTLEHMACYRQHQTLWLTPPLHISSSRSTDTLRISHIQPQLNNKLLFVTQLSYQIYIIGGTTAMYL